MDYHVVDVRPGATDLLLDLARPGVRLLEPARAVEPEREERDEAGGRAEEAKLSRLRSGRLANDASDLRLVTDVHLPGGAAFGQRLEMGLHARDLRNSGTDRRLQLLRDRVCLVERKF